MSDYTGILNTETAAEIFGDDARPFYPERAETFCAQITSCNGAVIVALEKRIAELERERDAAIEALKLAPEAIKNIYDMLDFIQAQSPQSAEGLRYVHIRTARFQEALKAIDAK